jgi:hypothetical protein
MAKQNTTDQKVFGRFRVNSVGGRMLTYLSDGKPRTTKEIARVAKPRSVENIDAAGGWYPLLRRFGKRSRQFDLSKTDDGKIQLTLRRAARKAA